MGQRWHDFAVLSFDYDGQRVSFDPAQRVVRQIGDVTEIIQRDERAEAAALEDLLNWASASRPRRR
jgi:hypothetical protein